VGVHFIQGGEEVGPGGVIYPKGEEGEGEEEGGREF